MHKTSLHLLFSLLLSTALPSCDGCQDNKPVTWVTESELELQEGEVFLTPCELLAIEIVRSSSFYEEYFAGKEDVFVGIANKEAVRAGDENYYALSVQENIQGHAQELTLELETLVLTHNRDDRQKAIAFDPALKERFRKTCVPEK